MLFKKELESWKDQILSNPKLTKFLNIVSFGDYQYNEELEVWIIPIEITKKGILGFKKIYLTYRRIKPLSFFIHEKGTRFSNYFGLPSIIFIAYDSKIQREFNNIEDLIKELIELNNQIPIIVEECSPPSYC